MRDRGRFGLEEGIRKLTSDGADLFGFSDRGRLVEGACADLNVIDYERLELKAPEFVHDFPNGAGRWTSKPDGVKATIVNGVPIVVDGELQPDPGLPGHVLKPGVPR